jgi:hypothetical protein
MRGPNSGLSSQQGGFCAIAGKRIQIEDSAVPGTEHVIAVLVCNAPLAEPVGTIFMRYATLAIE